MTISELSCGNWVKDKVTQFRMYVHAIYNDDTVNLDFEGNEADVWDTDIKDIEPIDIDMDIVDKAGFFIAEEESGFVARMDLGDFHLELNMLSNSNDRAYYLHVDNAKFQSVGGSDIQYVHQLQNAVKLMTGLDLDIKL